MEPSDKAYRIAARNMYASDDLELDDDDTPIVSRPEDGSGAWVAAWVWVGSDHESDVVEGEG